ncbi:TPR-like protein [Suillus decipiens]|nr:TPR-like protein [Suillus decipiens]
MSVSLQGRYIKLEVIGANNVQVPSCRIPAGIYVSIIVDSKRRSRRRLRRRWKSEIGVLSSDESVAWDDTVTLSLDVSPQISMQIRASFESDRMLGYGELVGKFKISRNALLNHGNEPFNISFPPVRGVRPCLTLKATVLHPGDYQDSALLDSMTDNRIVRETDAGHERFAAYVTSGTVSHLNDAIQHFQSVLDQCQVDHPDRAGALANLAWACLEGYIQNDFQDINSVTSLFREALALRPQGHPDHLSSIYHLTEALNWRHDYQHTSADICESAQLYCKLLPLCPEGTYLHSIAARANGVDYVIDECNKLSVEGSDEGINIRRVVLKLCPLGNKHRPRALDKLGWALRSRFEQRGSTDDLDESMRCHREAVALCSEADSERYHYLNNLASSLQSRFDHQGNHHDLNDAISLYEEALHLCPVEHKSHDSSLNNLGLALSIRFNQCGDVNDINRSISLQREALTLRPPGHPYRDYTLNNLALALKVRYNELDVSKDLNEAIDLYRNSLQLKQHDHPFRHQTLYSLSSALSSRFMQTQKNEDVEEAIRLCQESLEALPSLHPERCLSYGWLQEAYLCRYRVQRKSADLSLAVENFRLASQHPTQGFPDRIWTAWRWIVAAERHGHASALEAYATFFDLFDRHLATRSSAISRREAAATFHHARSAPVDAGSCGIRGDNLRYAVELMERGRGQQWSLASRLKTPVEDLESEHPNLAHRFLELSKCLSEPQGSTVSSTDRATTDRAETHYRKITEQWGTVVAEIRNQKGFSRFLLPPSYEELQVAARYGPVIIFIASQYSCSAIIVPTSGEPHNVPLPSISVTELKNLKDRFARAIREASWMSPTESRTDLIVLSRIIWDNIMLPIVNVLEHVLKLKRHSRIWLCPTADFTSIPLHAANPFLTKPDSSGKEPCLEDLYICSYALTLSALVRSRQMMKKRVPPSFVAIGQGQPRTGKSKELLTVDSEIELVRKLVPAMVNRPTVSGDVQQLVPVTVNRSAISGDAATRAGTLQALEENNWVHLACHGKQDHEQPYNSHFVMKDEPVTLLDIMEKDVPHAEFAFLSACHTAVGDKETPDEVIHLAAGLQFSGFKSVIGTLWEVNDACVEHVVRAFYENMFKGGVMNCTRAAWALNRATHAVKTKVPLEQRMVFIHVGV